MKSISSIFRTKDTLELAKKEGTVVVAGSPDLVMRNEIIPKFTARFGIPVQYIAGGASQIVARLSTERNAEARKRVENIFKAP